MTPWELRPARDHGLTLRQRLRSLRREAGLLGVAGGALWRGLARAYLAAMHGLEVVGRENLPAAAPVVLVGNHTSHLDALALTAALPAGLAWRAVALAAGDTFFNTVARSAFAATALNAMPISRRGTRPADLALLRQRLVEDRLVYVLFPEGTRSRDGRMGRFKPGLGALVAGTEVPVLPCFLHGAHACWPPLRKLPRPGPLRLVIGAPLSFAAAGTDRAGWHMVARTAEDAVRRLGGMMDDIKDDGTAASSGIGETPPPKPEPPAKPLRSVGPESEVRGGPEAPED